MLQQIADHSRIVNPTPSDAYVAQRKEAVLNLVDDDSLEVEALEAFVVFAVFGVPSVRGEQHRVAAQQIVTAIQSSQPSFASDIDANQFDLRLVAAICIGERIRNEPTDSVNVYVSSLIRSALLLQPTAREVHLAQLLKELVSLAEGSLHQAAEALRQRLPWPSKAKFQFDGADASAVAGQAKLAFDALLAAVTANSRADREELDTLWWIFGGRSARNGQRFDSMSEGERAVLTAVELSERMQMPPIATASHLLQSLFPHQEPISLAALAEGWRKETLLPLVDHKSGVATILESHASLLPLTWLAARLLASDMSPGWQHEFERKTRLKADSLATPGEWARQVFAECIAQQLALPLAAEEDAT